MSLVTIYHNGECSKCRGALEILQEQNIPHQVRWYLADPLTREEIAILLNKLHIPPSALVRKTEAHYVEQYEGKDMSEEEWLDILVQNPSLIQRPIVEKDEKAIIARPPELVLAFLGL